MTFSESLDDTTVFITNYGHGLSLDIQNGETWLLPLLVIEITTIDSSRPTNSRRKGMRGTEH